MTVLTISTVGFHEVKPLSRPGQIFTSFYILLNLGLIAYLISTLTTYIFEGELKKIYNKYMIGREARKLSGHVILCGYGRNGERAAAELLKHNTKFLVVEINNIHLENLPERLKFNVIVGDATSDEVLKEAGIERASSIITTLPSDADNVFIALTAKELNSNIRVISRASDEGAEKKLKRAGANMVVMPDALGGLHMAHLITKPSVIEFLNILNGLGTSDYSLEEIPYDKLKPEYQEKSIHELDFRKRTGVSIVGMKDPKEGIIFSPSTDKKIHAGSVIIVLGKLENITTLKQKYTWD